MVELEDVMLRRDYKLKAHFRLKCKCGQPLRIFRHGGIKQICLSCRNVYLIKRECNRCGTITSFEVSQCPKCEDVIRAITQLEVSIEHNSRGINKAEKKLLRKEIDEPMYDSINTLYKDEIESCEEKLKELKRGRAIEISSRVLINLR